MIALRTRSLQSLQNTQRYAKRLLDIIRGLASLRRGSREALEQYVQNYQAVWSKSEWAGRQVAAATPRMGRVARNAIQKVLASRGLLEGLGVLAHLDLLGEMRVLDSQLRKYLFWRPQGRYSYPLQKIVI